MDKIYYTIYKITNKIDGKFYIGSHKTKNLDDTYMGSGKYLKYAQEKYGLENFEKEILFVFETADEMYLKEAEIVNEEFIATENTYNLKIGGFGGWDYTNQNITYDMRLKISSAGGKSANKNGGTFKGKTHTDETKKKMSKKLKGKLNPMYGKPSSFKGKTHTDETKKKISEKNSISQSKENNSQYGTMWITNGIENKKIKKDEPIPEGWNKGRKVMRT
jgi:group I intron endonuclease